MKRRPLLASSTSAVVGFALLPSASAADLGSSHLQVVRSQSAMDCPDEAALADAIRRLSSDDDPRSDRLVLDVQLDHLENTYSATIRVSGRKNGVRSLSAPGPSCSALSDALALTVAILTDRNLAPPVRAPVPVPVQAPARATPVQPLPTVTPLHAGASLTASAAYGLPDRSSWLGAAGLDLRRGRYELGLSFFYAPPVDRSFGQGSIRLTLWGGQLAVCGRTLGSWDSLRLDLCALAALARLGGQASGYDTNASEHRPWMAAGSSVRAGFPSIGPVQPIVSFSAFLPLAEETFSIAGLGQAYATRSVSFSSNLTLRMSIL